MPSTKDLEQRRSTGRFFLTFIALVALAGCGADQIADRLIRPPERSENIGNVTSLSPSLFDSHDVSLGQNDFLSVLTLGPQGLEPFCGGQVTWTSSNTSVGTVTVTDQTNSCSLSTSRATFQALGVGSTVVTVSANGRSLSITLTVTAPSPQVTPGNPPTITGPGTYSWNATVYPCLTDCTVVWTRTNRGVATTIKTESAVYQTGVTQTLVAQDYGTIRVTANRNGQPTSYKEWVYDLRNSTGGQIYSTRSPSIAGPGTYTWEAYVSNCPTESCKVHWYLDTPDHSSSTELAAQETVDGDFVSSTASIALAAGASGVVVVRAFGSNGPGTSHTFPAFAIPTPPPASPLSVGLDGPRMMPNGSTGTWSASVSGGQPPYTYEWHSSFPGLYTATTPSITAVNIQQSSSIYLRVTDAANNNVTQTIYVAACAFYPCY